MALFDDLTKGPLSSTLFGLGVLMVAPTVVPAIATGLRPLAKALVRGGLTLYDAAREGLAEAGEEVSDLVAESRSELADLEKVKGGTDQTNGTDEEPITTTPRSRRRRSH